MLSSNSIRNMCKKVIFIKYKIYILLFYLIDLRFQYFYIKRLILLKLNLL